MRCEQGVEKSGVKECSGRFCEPDGFDAFRIAQNFSQSELVDRIAQVEKRLNEKPDSCEVQHAFNQLAMALRMKGVYHAQRN